MIDLFFAFDVCLSYKRELGSVLETNEKEVARRIRKRLPSLGENDHNLTTSSSMQNERSASITTSELPAITDDA
jgi:hypothetical protein